MIDPIKKYFRTPEEIKLFYQRSDLEMKVSYMKAMKIFISQGKTEVAEWIADTVKYFNHLSKVRSKDRLLPKGKEKGIMVIGINPSVQSSLDNVWNDPYGIYLKSLLDQAGINSEEIWITNLYKKKTPENRPLNDEEIEIGLKELRFEIKYSRPRVIVMFGRQVQSAMDPDHKGNEDFQKYQMIGLYHPSFIRQHATPEQKVEFINQLKKVKNLLIK